MAIRLGVGLSPLQVLEDRPSGEGLPRLGTGALPQAPRTGRFAVQILMENHGRRLTSEEHELLRDLHREPRSGRQRVDYEEPSPGSVAAHGDAAGAADARDRDFSGALGVRQVEEAWHTLAPRDATRLRREVSSRRIPHEVQQAVNVNQARSVFVDPHDGGAIGPDQLLGRGEMPQEA